MKCENELPKKKGDENGGNSGGSGGGDGGNSDSGNGSGVSNGGSNGGNGSSGGSGGNGDGGSGGGDNGSSGSMEEKGNFGNYFLEPAIYRDVYTPTNITGMYRKIISAYLSGTKYKMTKVLPAINKEQEPDHGDTLIVLKRGAVASNGMGVMGNKASAGTLPPGLPNSSSFSGPDSKSYSSMQNLAIEITLYGENLAEIETLSYLVYKLISAYGNDVLSKYTPNIKYVTSPTLSEVVPSKKHTDRYECYISFSVTYMDETILLLNENMIKYLRITVTDEETTNIISSNGVINK